MMIPHEYILALITTTVLLLYRLVDITNKYINIILNVILSWATGLSWTYVMIKEWNLHLWGNEPSLLSNLLLLGVIGSVIGFVIVIFMWKDNIETSNDNVQQPTYTIETLIGMTGVISDEQGSNPYLGKLDDEAGSNILVYVNTEHARKGDKFTIVQINDGKIFANIEI